MGKVFPELDDNLTAFIRAAPMFFVATAPLAATGHVNCSPRGLDTLRVLGPRRVAWLDLIGSSAETVAHLRENGRITLMFCAFSGRPRVLRLHGTGVVRWPGSPEWERHRPLFAAFPGDRALIDVSLTRIADSCGYAVPRMRLEGDREQLTLWAERKGPDGLARYVATHNRTSLDGLPAIDED